MSSTDKSGKKDRYYPNQQQIEDNPGMSPEYLQALNAHGDNANINTLINSRLFDYTNEIPDEGSENVTKSFVASHAIGQPNPFVSFTSDSTAFDGSNHLYDFSGLVKQTDDGGWTDFDGNVIKNQTFDDMTLFQLLNDAYRR